MKSLWLLLSAAAATIVSTLAAAAPFLYVTNFTSNNVSVIDIATNTVTATIPLGGNGPNGIASNAAGTRVYVAMQTDQAVVVIDTATNTVITTIALVGCQTTSGVNVDSANNRVYATCSSNSDTVTVIDAVTNTQLTSFAVGNNPHIAAFHPASSRLYVPNQNDDSLSVVNTATNTVIATVPVGDFPNYAAVNSAGTRVYTTNSNNNVANRNISVIDTATNTVVATFAVTQPPPLPASQNGSLFGIEVSPDGSRLYVAGRLTLSNFVDVLDANTGAILTTIAAGGNPRGTAISADGSLLAVVNQSANSVAIINLATNTTVATIPVGSQPLNVAMVPGPPPTVTINQAAGQADPALAGPVNFTVVFSENVTGFDAADLSFAGSTAGGTLTAVVTGGPATYNVAVSGMTSNGTVIASATAGAAIGSLAGTSLASTSTDNTVTLNDPPPSVTIDQAAGQADPTTTAPINFTVVFSENVTGFDAADVSFAGSTAGGTLGAVVTGGPATYNVAVSGMASSGTVVASVVAGAATGSLAGASLASTSTDNTVTIGGFDVTSPGVTINQAVAQADPTGAGPILFTVSFSEPVTGFTASDVSFAGSTVGGTLALSVSGSGSTYSISVTGMTGNGTVVASIPAGAATDGSSNLSLASTSTDNIVAFDAVAPTVTINQAPGQADPTSAGPILLAVNFSEAVTGFTAADVSLAGSTVGGTLVANVSGSGASYTVSVTGMTGNGTVVASIPAGAAADASSNASLASSSTDNTVTFAQLSSALSPSPATLDFGGQSMSTTAPAQTVTLTNVSGVSLSLSSVSTTSHYGVTHDCSTLAAGASCVAVVTFRPGAEGSLAGTLTVASSVGSVAVPLAGVGERSLVTHFYRSILRRAPDAGGKAYWLGEAARAQALGLDANEAWYAMAQQFYESAEYLGQGRGDPGFVVDLYTTFLDRFPDPAGQNYWVTQISGGMPRGVALTAFMFSAEFVGLTRAVFGTTTVRAEVNLLTDFYRGFLSRLPDDGGFAPWLGRLRAAQCAAGSAVTGQAEIVSSGFALGAEYSARNRSNSQYIGDLYNAFLRRGGDLTGVLFWLGEINSGARSRENVRQAFVASPEFQGRVGQVIAQGCF